MVLALATTVWASDQVMLDNPVEVPSIDRDCIYDQGPINGYWWTINASTPFGSEAADDIPNDLYCHEVGAVTFIGLEWAAYSGWQDPAGVIVTLYNGQCPPAQTGDEYYFDWMGPDMDAVLIYEDYGYSMFGYEITCYFCPPFHIDEGMSLGFALDLTWGQNSPYGGTTMTEFDYVYGCGMAYWDGENWGVPRWTRVGDYFGYNADIVYSLCEGVGPSATESSTWGSVKGLYR
jgi:hypothetical protein